jgi:FKBP-type peptidyl-prolyl cis-trans isomerase FkpA
MKNLVLGALASIVFMAVACESEIAQISDSGYAYVMCIDEQGEPGAEGDFVFIHAKLFAGDSLIFDSRDQGESTPIQLPESQDPRGQLAPLQDMIALMSVGDSLRFDYPLDSFKAQRPQLPSGVEFVTYDIKVLDIMSTQEFEVWRGNRMRKTEDRFNTVAAEVATNYAAFKNGSLDAQIKRTDSGLGYILHKQGVGELPIQGSIIDAQYFGILASDGKMFDNSFQRGQPLSFQIGMGMVIPGWDEGFALFNAGTKATLFIPADLAYGERGSPPVIPGGAELIFYIELENVR